MQKNQIKVIFASYFLKTRIRIVEPDVDKMCDTPGAEFELGLKLELELRYSGDRRQNILFCTAERERLI